MKIQISNEVEGYKLYKESDLFPLKNYRAKFISPFTFYDEDIEKLIGEKAYSTSFQNGKYQYNVSANHLKLITGERLAQNRNELELYKD